MFRAVPTKRFYLYTAKWNRDRLVNALLDFNEVELTDIKDPELKPLKETTELDEFYTKVLLKLKLKLEEIEEIVGKRIRTEDVEGALYITPEDVEKLLKKVDEKIALLRNLLDPKLIEKRRKELEEVNNKLAWLEEEILSSLEPKVRASLRIEEKHARIFEVLSFLEENIDSMEKTIKEIAQNPSKIK
ncbi:MAG: hypothetical protein DRN92_02780, partial [Thermoproteota archaeon]